MNKHDMRRFTPDVAKILRETTPEKIEARQRRALQGLVEAGLIERLTPTPLPPKHETEAAASPWAGGEAAALDKAALPSAMGPAEERPVTKPARPIKRRRWPATWIVVLGCVGVMLTAMLMAVLVVTARAKEAADKAAAMMSAAAMVPAETAVPSATVAPSAVTPSPPPSTSPAASTTAAPSVATDAGAPKRSGALEPVQSADDPYAEPSPKPAPAKSKPPPMVF